MIKWYMCFPYLTKTITTPWLFHKFHCSNQISSARLKISKIFFFFFEVLDESKLYDIRELIQLFKCWLLKNCCVFIQMRWHQTAIWLPCFCRTWASTSSLWQIQHQLEHKTCYFTRLFQVTNYYIADIVPNSV